MSRVKGEGRGAGLPCRYLKSTKILLVDLWGKGESVAYLPLESNLDCSGEKFTIPLLPELGSNHLQSPDL